MALMPRSLNPATHTVPFLMGVKAPTYCSGTIKAFALLFSEKKISVMNLTF